MNTQLKYFFILGTLYLIKYGETCFPEEPQNINGIPHSQNGIQTNFDNAFDFDLFQRIALGSSKSFVLSPYGIWNVLALAYIGTEGRTRRNLEAVLRLGTDKRHAISYVDQLNNVIINKTPNDPTTLTTKNTAYFSNILRLNNCIKQTINNIELVNFSDAVTTAKIINDDVSKTTNGKIKKAVNADDILAANFVLINAIYFKGDWKLKFDRTQTSSVWFTDHTGLNNISQVNMMVLKENIFNYVGYKGIGSRMVELPYEGDEVSMYIMLPDKSINPINVVRSLTPQRFERAVSLMQRTMLNIAIPRFKISSHMTDELKKVLIEQGIDIFNPNANFSSFTNDANIYVNSVNHKALIEVNEDGTEATAFTSLISLRSGPSRPLHFICNRPFMFFIRHKRTGSLLFAGWVKTSADFEN